MSFIYFNLFRNPQDAYLKKPVVIIIYLYILCLQLFVCLCPKNVKMAEQIDCIPILCDNPGEFIWTIKIEKKSAKI